jgi:hypothetical protein
MPTTQIRAQQPFVPYAYSSSSSESSILDRRTPFPYIRIPKISLLEYGWLLGNEETFDKVMAINEALSTSWKPSDICG